MGLNSDPGEIVDPASCSNSLAISNSHRSSNLVLWSRLSSASENRIVERPGTATDFDAISRMVSRRVASGWKKSSGPCSTVGEKNSDRSGDRYRDLLRVDASFALCSASRRRFRTPPTVRSWLGAVLVPDKQAGELRARADLHPIVSGANRTLRVLFESDARLGMRFAKSEAGRDLTRDPDGIPWLDPWSPGRTEAEPAEVRVEVDARFGPLSMGGCTRAGPGVQAAEHKVRVASRPEECFAIFSRCRLFEFGARVGSCPTGSEAGLNPTRDLLRSRLDPRLGLTADKPTETLVECKTRFEPMSGCKTLTLRAERGVRSESLTTPGRRFLSKGTSVGREKVPLCTAPFVSRLATFHEL